MAALVFVCTCLLAFSSCTVLGYEAISIVNFRKVPNSDGAGTNNISFAFEVTPPIQYGGPLTYDIVLSWEEELKEYSGSISSYYYRSRYYSRTCREYGNLRRNGQTYQFSVSKATLGSGPLYVSVSASLFCNESNSRYYYRYCLSSCSSWQFKGQSDLLRVDTIHGSIAAFEVDLQLWPKEECHEFDTALPMSEVEDALVSALRMATKAPTTTSFGIYNSHYSCIHKNFVTMRGVIMKTNDSLATSLRDVLSTWLSERSTLVIGDREVKIRAGRCGLALSTVNDPVCGGDYPDPPSSTSPNTSQNSSSNLQSGSSAGLLQEVDTLKFSLLSVCFVSGGLIIVIAVLVVYSLYRWRKRRQSAVSVAMHSFSNIDDEDETGNLVFSES